MDICYRLGLQGYAIGLASQAVVLHEDRATVCAHFRRFRDYAVYQVLLYAKYKRISGRPFVVNPYPFTRVRAALAAAPWALVRLLRGDTVPAAKLVLQLVEAVGVWWGDVLGSLRFRQLYL